VRVPQAGLVVAMFGAACVGKTALAARLATDLRVPCRHCGELLKQRAAQLALRPAELSKEAHIALDEETRSVAAEAVSSLVIEGSFLDRVLVTLHTPLFVRLTCDEQERRRRFHARLAGQSMNVRTLEDRDHEDARLRHWLYSDKNPASWDCLVVDTTSQPIEELSNYLTDYLGRL